MSRVNILVDQHEETTGVGEHDFFCIFIVKSASILDSETLAFFFNVENLRVENHCAGFTSLFFSLVDETETALVRINSVSVNLIVDFVFADIHLTLITNIGNLDSVGDNLFILNLFNDSNNVLTVSTGEYINIRTFVTNGSPLEFSSAGNFEHGNSGRDLLIVFTVRSNVRAANKDILLVAPEELLNVSDVDGSRVTLRISKHLHFREFENRDLVITDSTNKFAIITPLEGSEDILL